MRQAWFHPSSINASPPRGKAEGGLFVYVEKTQTSRFFLRGEAACGKEAAYWREAAC